MTRSAIYKDIEATLGILPSIFKELPDSSLEMEWSLFKRDQLEPGPISSKNRHLIGLALAATSKCQYSVFYHTKMAEMFGATAEEIEDAVHFAMSSAGWSTYLTGLEMDFEAFKKEILQACEHLRTQQPSLIGAGI